MQFAEEAVQVNQCHFPVYETGFTPNEIQLLSSLFESTDPVSPNSCLEGSSQPVYSPDEMKERRKMLNRQSARQSRLRKQRHLESLTDEANRLSVENRKLKKWLDFVINQRQALWRENDLLISESIALSARLSDLRCILAALQSYTSVDLNNQI